MIDYRNGARIYPDKYIGSAVVSLSIIPAIWLKDDLKIHDSVENRSLDSFLDLKLWSSGWKLACSNCWKIPKDERLLKKF